MDRSGKATTGLAQRPSIIRRKLEIPLPGAATVHRPRVSDRLRCLLASHRIVTVCASAGAGKTTAVAGVVRSLDRPAAWVSLDGTEQPARLLVYLEESAALSVPAARRAASDALCAGLHPGEAAGLLAESLEGSGLVIVCDDVERGLAADEASATVLDAFARYLPDGTTLVLVSSTDVRLPSQSAAAPTTGTLGEADLAFTVDEAAEALRRIDRPGVDAREAVARTGGWVTGVLFGWWGGDATPPASGLHEYLATNVIGPLDPVERAFLLHTSLLDEVTVPGARALGHAGAPRIMARLRSIHLPVSWSRDGTRMTPHGQFRDFLQGRLCTEEPETHELLQRRHADFLLDQGAHEEAVDALLRIGDIDRAWDRVATILPDLVARMDFAPAARWLDQLGASSRCPSPQVGAVVLRVAFALEHFDPAAEMLERFGDRWLPGPGVAGHEEATVLAAWCLWHLGRVADAVELVSRLPDGRPRTIAMVLMGLATGEDPELPAVSGAPPGPLDGILVRCAYLRGRVAGLDVPAAADPWHAVLGAPWVVAGLRATGRIDEAMSMYELRRASDQPLWLHAFDAVELMLDVGRGSDAWESLRSGRTLAVASGSRIYPVLSQLMEAKLWLRLHHDPGQAERALDAAEAAGMRNYAFAHEVGQMWRGLSLLLRNRNAEAQRVLEKATESMRIGDRRLELATASAYLAEAHWRMGDESGSDAAAHRALEVSSAQGVQHLLLAALTDVPEVATRSADASPTRMSRWHEITELLSSQEAIRVRARPPRMVLEEFGPPSVTVDGEVVPLTLTKSLELLCFLVGRPEQRATRQQILDAVFDGRNDASSRSYLRQALFRLRAVLPADLAPQQDGAVYSLPASGGVVGTARSALDLFALAARQPDEERLSTLQDGIGCTTPGPYLMTLTNEWVTSRRVDIGERIANARVDAARIAFRLSRHALARRLLDEVLRDHPHREQAWQLAISVAHATGSDDAVLTTFRRYGTAMREFGVGPSAEVRRLVARLRR
ncbi:BTAD domain-containing putative transcriptional regulator [Pseudonocardia sp. N23]|uniref:BTAD domain-containing putative transcriptional regulator n=1 Tax=Pseudonocardia sp. N23 TaxID=1987376 RepID=UPI000BFC8C0F|nr:BTAD domain-containing putative transcriptional regulator [Pseudonocardia sp. N23]GAY07671.1 regulatory protein, LuxR [Pseudonocardia sp. N23]